MWPFKRKALCVYLIYVYTGGRESRQIKPIVELNDGRWAIEKHSDDVLLLLPDGKVSGEPSVRWEVLDDIPGLTDDEITPTKLAEMAAKRADVVEAHLRTVIAAALEFRRAKTGQNLRQAENALNDAIFNAEIPPRFATRP